MRRLLSGFLCLAMLPCVAGCNAPWRPSGWWNNWLNPTKNIRKPDEASVMPIMSSVDPIDPHEDWVPNAEPPQLEDLTWSEEDYVLGPGDIIQINVLDLLAEGVETPMQRTVENSGNITVLQIPQPIRVGGLTVNQAREAVGNAYKPNILRDPQVSVTVLASRQNIFSILGAVGRPGTYNLPRAQFTVLEALAMAGDVTQTPIHYIYVIRPTQAFHRLSMQQGLAPVAPTPGLLPRQLSPEALPPMPGLAPAPAVGPRELTPETLPPMPGLETQPMAPAPAPATGPTTEDEIDAMRELLPGPAPMPITQPVKPTLIQFSEMMLAAGPGWANELARPGYSWVYRQGEWVRVPAEPSTAPAPQIGPRVPLLPETATQPQEAQAQGWTPPEIPALPTAPADDPYGWGVADLSHLARVIVIDLDKLREGDPRQNIIVRDDDIIQVPTLEVGEFYVTGEVNRPGVYSLTGRRVTVRMALAAAGELNDLGWPSNSVLVRRIGSDQEVMIPLNIDLIVSGREPDIFLKPNDVIAVGTHVAAPFLAVMRNAFRMTYGFGFIYDRNFAEKNFGQFNGIEDIFFH